MIEIKKPRIECIETPADNSYGKYIIEPLERGYGTTLGNSLRRVLLSSLPGTACTSIKIAGVQHEFSTIPGVKEDVTEIVLNVKSIIARLHSTGPKTVYIEASGEGVVTAGDIKADAEVEILNPEQPIATLGPDGALNMELVLDHGRGYVSAEKNKNPQMPIGISLSLLLVTTISVLTDTVFAAFLPSAGVFVPNCIVVSYLLETASFVSTTFTNTPLGMR